MAILNTSVTKTKLYEAKLKEMKKDKNISTIIVKGVNNW